MGFPSWLCFDTMEASSQTGTRENGGTLAANVESVGPALCHTCGTNHGSHHPSPTHVLCQLSAWTRRFACSPHMTRCGTMVVAHTGSPGCEVTYWDLLADLLVVCVKRVVDSPLQVLHLDLLEVAVVHAAWSEDEIQEEPTFAPGVPPPSNDGPNHASMALNDWTSGQLFKLGFLHASAHS
jgi:hypothetical protein